MRLLRVTVIGGEEVSAKGRPWRWRGLRLFGVGRPVPRPLTLGGGGHGGQRCDEGPGQGYLREQTRGSGKGGSFHTLYYGAVSPWLTGSRIWSFSHLVIWSSFCH
jgi:hypothetical protein